MSESFAGDEKRRIREQELRLAGVTELKSRMKPRGGVENRRFHQAPRWHVVRVPGFQTGDEHPVVEGAGIFLAASFEPAPAVYREVRFTFLAPERARVGSLALFFDARVELGSGRIIRQENIQDAGAAGYRVVAGGVPR